MRFVKEKDKNKLKFKPVPVRTVKSKNAKVTVDYDAKKVGLLESLIDKLTKLLDKPDRNNEVVKRVIELIAKINEREVVVELKNEFPEPTKTWNVVVTNRDNYGRIKAIEISAEKEIL